MSVDACPFADIGYTDPMRTYLVNRPLPGTGNSAIVAALSDSNEAEALCDTLNRLRDTLDRDATAAEQIARLDTSLAAACRAPDALRHALREGQPYEWSEADLGECGCGGG